MKNLVPKRASTLGFGWDDIALRSFAREYIDRIRTARPLYLENDALNVTPKEGLCPSASERWFSTYFHAVQVKANVVPVRKSGLVDHLAEATDMPAIIQRSLYRHVASGGKGRRDG